MVKTVNAALCALILGLTLVTSGCAEHEAEGASISEIARGHDRAMRQELGIGISAAGLLVSVSPNAFLLEDSLSDPERDAYKSLEGNGYIEAKRAQTAEGMFVQYTVTAKGEELRKVLR